MITPIQAEEWAPVTSQAEDMSSTYNGIFGGNFSRAEIAETFVIGATLFDAAGYRNVLESLTANDFIFSPSKICFIAISELFRMGREINFVSVFELIRARKEEFQFQNNDPAAFLVNAREASGVGIGIEYYAGLVRDLAMKRRALTASIEFQNQLESREPAYSIINRVSRDLGTISDRQSNLKTTSMADASLSLLKIINETMRNGGKRTDGIPTGFRDLDDILGGLHSGQLGILAARPSVGKSAFVGAIAKNISKKQKRVLFFRSK